MIRLLLVDDQRTVREVLRMRFSLEADLCVVGEAGNGIEALQLAQQLTPDVVVMDVEMPQMDGIATTERLRALMPTIEIVMLSIHGDSETRARARAAGAAAFVEKQGEITTLLDAVHRAAVHAG